MDDIKPKNYRYGEGSGGSVTRGLRPFNPHSNSVPNRSDTAGRGYAPQYDTMPRSAKRRGVLGRFFFWTPLWVRVFAAVGILLIIAGMIFPILDSYQTENKYDISNVEYSILSAPVPKFEQKLEYDSQNKKYVYNQKYQQSSDVSGQSSGPKITAEFQAVDGKVTITDPINEVSLGFVPKFGTADARKNQNRILYPIDNLNATKVYTLRSIGVKEDIIVHEFQGKELEFKYDLELSNGLDVRLEKDGSLGVYGVDPALLGNVSTGSDEDAKLLQNARENGKKNALLFTVPRPVVIEKDKKVSQAKVEYRLDGKELTIAASDLDKGNYPLSIDPSVYVETAAKLMRGNNESNVDFDIDNELIQKSQTTGARIDAWSSTTNLTSAVWAQGTAVAGGFIYSVGGVGSSTTVTTPYDTAGTDTYTVPAGITSITVKAWGGGGAGGNGDGGTTGTGGNGGGGGYAKAVLSVTPGETLDVTVGSGGADSGTVSSGGGNGGGFSAVQRSGTYLIQAGGGGGGGGARGNNNGNGGAGGAGGGATAVNGSQGSSSGGGGGYGGSTTLTGTPSDGGAAGTGGTAGASGVANAGGNGAGSDAATCNDAMEAADTGGNGGFGGGGADGNDTSSCSNGGGGGGGRFGGGGGGSTTSNNVGGGGGGGGSSLVTGTSTVETAGSGTTPGNSADSDRAGAGDGGTGGTSTSGGTAGDDGIVLISYTTLGSVSSSVYWAKFNTTTNAIESPNPGTGACSGWCTNSAYNLPTALQGLSVVAYNGFLYAIGGSTSGGTPQTTVYIAKLGANGEPQLWHPTGGTPVYWYTDTALSNARSNFAAVAYNNRMYILGGLTTSSTILSSNTVQYADIKPNGTLTTWTSTGMQALSTARYGVTAHVYNDVMYVLGGSSTFGGAPVTTVEYSKLKSDGTMNSWVATTSLITSGRLTLGGSFSTIFSGYLYVAGGCTAMNASGYCTSIASDVQLASINADGSLAEFNTILNLTNDRFSYTLIAWQGGLYRLGGCRAQDPSSGGCTNTVLDVDYGVINPDGEASTVATSSASGAGTCTGTPYNCDLPSASVGNMLNASVVVNGYLYIMGGCRNNACTSYSSGVTYQSIGSDGSLNRPASCSGSYTDSYCVSSTSLPSARGAPGVAVFNNTIYLIGGFPTITNISRTTVNPDGSIGSWTDTDFTDIAVNGIDDDLSYPFAYARANPSSAGSIPGNLFIFGGCTGTTSGIGCSSYSDSVYKCDISTTGAPSNCTTTGQLQIGTVTGGSGSGLGAHAGAVYANYIYLMGGLAPGITDLTTVRYAKFDDSNNVVSVSSGWVEGNSELNTGRRRGAGFGYNGFLYVLGGYDGNDAIADIEFAKINVSDGSWGAFDTSSVTIQKRWALTTVVTNSYAYVIGGCIAGRAPSSCNTRTNTIQTFQVYNNESGAIKSVTSMSDDSFAASTDRWGASAAVLNGYLYVAGGCISATDCTDATNNVQYAEISTSDGSIGTWSSATNGLPADRAWGQLEAVGGNLYYLGGQEDTATNEQSTVYYAGSFSSGNIDAAWSTASGGIGDTASQAAQARTKFSAAVWDDRIYVVGGLDGSAAVSNTVYITPKLSSGGNIAADSWVSDSDVPDVSRFGGTLISYANNLYYFGGNDGTNYLNDGQFASLGYKTGSISQSGNTVTGSGTSWTSSQVGSVLQYPDGSTATITAYSSATSITVDASKSVTAGTSYVILDGSVGAWTFTTSTPGYVSQADGFAANGYLYLVGGRRASASCAPKTLVAPISANTTIATGNNPTGVGEWSETNVRFAGGRYGAAVAYEEGKMYIVGGGCSSPQGGTYSTGTITQSGTTVTGAGGASWNDNYIGGTITYNDASTATIVSVNSATSLTVSVSKTIGSAQTYTITVPRHSYATLKSQPQMAIYSRMIDTDTDVFPTYWLMNGLDNSVGARWQLKYRSMHDLDTVVNPSEDCGTTASMSQMTTWGYEYNYGNVSLGDADTYVPRNGTSTTAGTITQSGTTVTGSGTSWGSDLTGGVLTYRDGTRATIVSVNSSTSITVDVSKTIASAQTYTAAGGDINCARYYYFYVTIDASRTFGYPEDVTRGPTITDLSLFFTSDPSKRLRHGKTFTGGELQPLDTPF